MLRDLLVQPRLFQDSDPWLYSVLNSVFQSMKSRDDQIADAIDAGGGLGGFPVSASWSGSATTTNYLPLGWTLTRTGAGVYTIVHNLNTTSYSVFPGVVNASPLFISISSISANSFVISIFNQAGTLTDSGFNCFVSRFG